MNRNIRTICAYNSQTISTFDATADEVARCLNSLTLLNMRNIASEDVLNKLMNDYFVTCLIGDDSDSSWEDCVVE